ncbi:MAG: ABC transporter ATP-binding protein [Planctomycetota bacterium]|nr:ABC transporter ATP-binding protein [Planctomycetota bacterium]
MLLEIDNIAVSYGPVQAVCGVSLHVAHGEIVTLLGANGAGKSTVLRAVSGLAPLAGGHIRLDGRDLGRLDAARIVRAGVAHCPEGRRVFGEMTVLENLDLGAYALAERGAYEANLQRAFAHFPILAERRKQKAATLSGGQQQMLAVARALMSSPRLLLLDEMSLGLAPMLVEGMFEILRQINREEGVTVLLVEQNACEALRHSDRAYVLENGRIILEGPSPRLAVDPKVIEAYLGA